MKRPAAELVRLQEISATYLAGKFSRAGAHAAVIDVIIGRLQCSRVSLWRVDGAPGQLALLCFASKKTGAALVTRELRLPESEYRAYFGGLVRTGMYISDDAMADADLLPMRANYLVPNQVRSMLDAAFLVNGRAYGMVCCEQTDALRRRRADEIAALRGIVVKLALLMASAGDAVLWGSPSRPMAPIPPRERSAPAERRR